MKSIYSVSADPDEVAIEGWCILQVQGSTYFGDGTSFQVKTHSPTWRTIQRYADASILCTRDDHHVFFEGVESSYMEHDVPVYEIVLGS